VGNAHRFDETGIEIYRGCIFTSGKPLMKWCSRELIRNPLYIGLCLSEKKFAKEMKRMGIENPPSFLKTRQANATAHFFIKDGEESVIVALGKHKGRDPIEIAGLLVHEAVHIWQAIKDNIGEHSPSMEFEAYSIQGISQQLMWAYAELTKP